MKKNVENFASNYFLSVVNGRLPFCECFNLDRNEEKEPFFREQRQMSLEHNNGEREVGFIVAFEKNRRQTRKR